MFRINSYNRLAETISTLLLYSVIISVIFVIKIITMKPNTNIHVPDSMKRKLKSKAAEDGLTMNSAILTAIALYLKLDQ